MLDAPFVPSSPEYSDEEEGDENEATGGQSIEPAASIPEGVESSAEEGASAAAPRHMPPAEGSDIRPVGPLEPDVGEHPLVRGARLAFLAKRWVDYTFTLNQMPNSQIVPLFSDSDFRQSVLALTATDHMTRRNLLHLLGHFYQGSGCTWIVRLVIPRDRWVTLNSQELLRNQIDAQHAQEVRRGILTGQVAGVPHSTPNAIQTRFAPSGFVGQYTLIWEDLRAALTSTTPGGFASLAMQPGETGNNSPLLTTVSGSPIKVVTSWLRGLTSAMLPASYVYVPLNFTPAAAVVQGPEAADPQGPLDAPAVVPMTTAPTDESLARFSADAMRMVGAQRIVRESLRTNGYRSEAKVVRYRQSMLRHVRRTAFSLDPRYPALGEHSTYLEDDQVKQAALTGVMDALDRILQSDDESDDDDD